MTSGNTVFMYLRVAIATMLLVFLANTVTESQPISEDKRKQKLEFERELQRLKRKNPGEYEDNRKLATLMAQLLPGRIGYGIGPYSAALDENTEKALREYQKLRNLPVTGDPLSFETFQLINKDTELLNYHPVTCRASIYTSISGIRATCLRKALGF